MKVSGQPQAPADLRPEETAPATHCTGDWVGPRADLDVMEKRKIYFPCQKSNNAPSAVHPVA
jgi:hypothetical protein